jgi:hypothetical protein
LDKNIRVYGAIHLNHRLPKDLVDECKKLKPEEVTFQQMQDAFHLSFPEKKLENMVSTLHTAETTDALRKRADTSKMRPKCVTDHNTYIRCQFC